MIDWIWLVPVFPLLGFLLISLGGKQLPKQAAGFIGSATVLASFLISLGTFLQLPAEPTTVTLFPWIHAGNFHVDFSFLVDPVSAVMLLIVTGVGFLIHVYSIGYMSHDEAFARFFSYLNLFVFFMLLLVLGDNYLVLFTGWEGVGLCSYLLIGFWFKHPEYNKAANKAFIMNRIGDLAFLLGIILTFVHFGSITFSEVFPIAKNAATNQPVIIAITLLFFIGATGKSAQLPLYTWLPDAMAGPTPVSALIHAATMVTAGLYMVVRSNLLYSAAPFTLEIIGIVGTATALFAAAIALTQTDIKKVLAYSTVSQLGYMFAALGCGAYASSLFHVTTHAFFKALLFLAAGSVIHAMGGEQDIRKMGGLRKKLPITYAVFLIGTLAIAGVPPFAGFFSKDEILAYMWGHNRVLFFFLAVTSVMTAFYMFRLFFLTFFGGFRGTHEQEHHLHESPAAMTFPLIVLAVLSTLGGFMGLPSIFSHHHALREFLEPVAANASLMSIEPSHFFEWALIATSLVVLAIVIVYAYNRYVKRANVPSGSEQEWDQLSRWSYHKFYVDEFYDALFVRPLRALGGFFGRVFDPQVLDGAVTAVNAGVNGASGLLRRVQAGGIGFYIFLMVFGIIAILVYNLVL